MNENIRRFLNKEDKILQIETRKSKKKDFN